MAGRIVVGIDGSEHSTAALRWALEEAQLRVAAVEAVHAWSYVPIATPLDGGLVPLAWAEGTTNVDAVREAAEQLAAEQVAAAGGRDVRVSVVEGDPVDALVTAARDADLLVVGTRGRSGLMEAILGSTSSAVVHHAPCPVVVVRADHPA